jgi:hypothetical protein
MRRTESVTGSERGLRVRLMCRVVLCMTNVYFGLQTGPSPPLLPCHLRTIGLASLYRRLLLLALACIS